jgi:ATP-binding cassette subfamily F protein 2
MPPKTAKEERQAAKDAKLAAKGALKKGGKSTDSLVSEGGDSTTGDEHADIDQGGRSATGVLISEPRARDIKISPFSLALHGHVLVEDTVIELNKGGRYGLLGRNGCGKSTFLRCLAAR